MTLLPDVSCSEVEPLEIRLHSLHEGANAGSLLGTRMRALFLQHCRRRALTRTRQYDARWPGKEVKETLPKNDDQRDSRKSQLCEICRRLHRHSSIERA